MADRVLVTGAGGFIGGHLVQRLLGDGCRLRCVDFKPLQQWRQISDDADNLVADLRGREACDAICRGATHVYHLAADMGGMGFIERNKARCMLSVLVDAHMLQAALDAGVKRFFFASSACVYRADKQQDSHAQPLKEDDAYPALPEDGYGWEKLFAERLCRHFREDFGLTTRVARFHNVYGPNDAWQGGRERVLAAICRKVIHAKETGDHRLEIWGDGNQTRSFMYIDDCTRGIVGIMNSDAEEPLNLGSSRLTTINELVDIVEDVAGIKLQRVYKRDAPKGVNGRNSDNTKIKRYLGWEPNTDLRTGVERTYAWIYEEYLKARAANRLAAAS